MSQPRKRKPTEIKPPENPVASRVTSRRVPSTPNSMKGQAYETNASQSKLKKAQIVVAIDFGTTSSGFAYASTDEPERVFAFYDWPCQAAAGARPYCKTQTSLWFLLGSPSGTVSLKDWGWPALFNYSTALQATRSSNIKPLMVASHASPGSQTASFLTAGYYVTGFKLELRSIGSDSGSLSNERKRPAGLSTRQLISDYLRQLSIFIMAELRNRFGNFIQKKDIKWCLTVPTIWTDAAKQTMVDCAELAGLVDGRLCPVGEDASMHKVIIVLEPEAASVYCQLKLNDDNLRKGSKFLVVDAGGGTVDLVVHEKAYDFGMKVKEVTIGTGDCCGGTFLDKTFMEYLAQKIYSFEKFSSEYPAKILTVKGNWENFKCSFDGEQSFHLDLPAKLAEAYETNEMKKGLWIAGFQYDSIEITAKDIRSFFDTEVNKIFKLINDQLHQVPDIKAILVVGGFSNSPYLMKRIQKEFSLKVKYIISPPDPGSAVCQGAVMWGIQGAEVLMSRKSRKTYGVDTIREVQCGDPSSNIVDGDNGEKLCQDAFCVFTRIGDDVPVNHHVAYTFGPFKKGESQIVFTMYSTNDAQPAFITDPGIVKVGSLTYPIPKNAWRTTNSPEVEVTMYFGRTHIEVSAKPANFNGRKKSICSVVFERDLV